MTEEKVDTEQGWLPNLVGGVSIWKLARDLNEPKFFDGRLLVPETEGSESLPSRVSWDLTGLMTLDDALGEHPEQVAQAIRDFKECLERVAEVFGAEDSGYHTYREGLTIPSLEADDGANYYFSPTESKLFVINWGASPRSVNQQQDYLFGYQNFDVLCRQAEDGAAGAAAGIGSTTGGGAGPQPGAGGQAAAAGGAAAAAGTEAEGDKEQEGDDEEESAGEKRRRVLLIIVTVLVVIGLLLLLLFFMLRGCGPLSDLLDGGLGGGDAGADGGGSMLADGAVGADGAAGDLDGGVDGSAGDVDGGGTDGAAEDASSDAAGDDADSGADGGDAADAGDEADASDEADAGDEGDSGGDEADSGGGGGGGGGGGSGEGRIVIINGREVWVGGSGGSGIELPHRSHFHPSARSWRVIAGRNLVHHTEGRGTTFHVYLHPGASFRNIRVQWRDGSGRWNNH